MADENTDLFLLLTTIDNKPLKGETLDGKLADRGMEINEFDVAFGKATTEGEDRKFSKMLDDLKGKVGSDVVEALKQQRDERLAQIKALKAQVAKLDAADKEAVAPSQTFSVKKYVDRSTAALIRSYNASSLSGKFAFKSAVVSSYRAGGGKSPYLMVTFGKVRILSYKISMSEPLPTEDIDFAFGQCQVEYWSQDEGGQASVLRARYAYDFGQGAVWRIPPSKA
jgi:type VI protein secretion system component Hcp